MTSIVELDPLLARAETLLAAARRAGADAADAVVVRGVSSGVEVRAGRVEDTERSEADDLGLRVFVGRRTATISGNAIVDPDRLAERAVAMARVSPEDAFAGLADPDLLARDFPDLDLCDSHEPTAEALVEEALALEEAALAVPGVTTPGGASASHGLTGFVLATSTGFRGTMTVTRHTRYATAIAGTGTGMERDFWGAAKTHAADLPDLAEIGRIAGERAVRRLNPRQIATTRTTVWYEPRAAAGLVGHLLGAINGASIARGTSFLRQRMGQKLFREGIHIVDDPLKARGLGSRPFDGEGVAARPLTLVEDGVLRSWLLDSATARELGLATNGRASRGIGAPSPGSTNVTLAPGALVAADLAKSIGTGFLVTDLIGQGANLVTGDYSRGASGFWIENGEIAYPVSEVTIAGSLDHIFAELQPADDLDDRFSIAAPSVIVEGLTVAGR